MCGQCDYWNGEEQKNKENKNMEQNIIEVKTKAEAVEQKPMASLEIKNLIVSPMPMRRLALGEVKDIIDITKRKEGNVDAVVWNEDSIALILKEENTQIVFLPEFHPASQMFFHREEKRDFDLFSDRRGIRIWEGDFEPVQFGKSNLIKFLKKHVEYFEPEIEMAIRNMKVTESKVESSEMLSLDDDNNVRTMAEETKTTNIPRQFKALMPLFGGYKVELDLEARVTKKQDGYGHEKDKNVIEIRCTNAREVIKQVMEEIVSQFPEKIPRYYGKTDIYVRER